MSQTFRDDQSQPDSRVWRRSPWGAVGNGVAIAFFIAIALGEAAAGVYVLGSGEISIAIVLLLGAAVIGALAQLLWRDMLGKRTASIALTTHGMQLDLRAGRSLTNHTAAIHELIPYSDVQAIEMRLEAFPTIGMAKMQRAFRLTRRNGQPIFLFEERGLGMFHESMTPLAEEMAQRAAVAITDLGMVEGNGGVLAAWFVTVPEWSAPAVTSERAQWLWRRVSRTNAMASVYVIP
jgi:hypothetical protein